jgi:hypothetical protein
MSPRGRSRVQPCGVREAQAKLRRAEQFVEVANLIRDEPDPDWASAAAALLVLAGISASDSACCKALGRRSRGEDHHDAEELLELIEQAGRMPPMRCGDSSTSRTRPITASTTWARRT